MFATLFKAISGPAVGGVMAVVVILGAFVCRAGETDLPGARPVPAMQVLPLPYDQASFQHDGEELTRYHFGASLQRPFLYPLAGPEGRSLTRMGHPRDPVTHSHHNSVWIAHQNVGGVNFWEDNPKGHIVCRRIEQYEDGADSAWLLGVNAWQDAASNVLMNERRRIEVKWLEPGQYRSRSARPPSDRSACGWPRQSVHATAAGDCSTPKASATRPRHSATRPAGSTPAGR
jgi:hypothetical protein